MTDSVQQPDTAAEDQPASPGAAGAIAPPPDEAAALPAGVGALFARYATRRAA